MTLQEIVTFILQNKDVNVKNPEHSVYPPTMGPADILAEIARHSREGWIYTTRDVDGKICGVIIWQPNVDSKVVEIKRIIITKHPYDIMKVFYHTFVSKYGTGWMINSKRHGKQRKPYSMDKILKVIYDKF
jgi:hypothetical protein